jgi:pilus assembly protein CpaB
VNPRQRRGVLLMLLSGLTALGVFAVVTSYVADVSARVGDLVTVYRASSSLPAYTTLDPERQLVAEQVPRKWTSDSALVAESDVAGRTLGVALTEGTILTRDMLVEERDLSPTQREIAVNVDAVTGVAGRIGTGDFVDIYAVFADVPGLTRQVRVLVRNVRVVSVRGVQQAAGDGEEAFGREVLPVTLALEPEDSLAVSYAAAFAKEVRLVRLPAANSERRTGEIERYDAVNLGGQPRPEGEQ